jgi:hypothetical protein
MSGSMQSVISFVFSMAILTFGIPLLAREPTAQDLIRGTRDITSHDAARKSIKIRGHCLVSKGSALRFSSTYKAPDRYSLIIRDGVDDTPLLVASDHKMFIYDPVRPAVLVADAMNVHFRAGLKGKSFESAIGVTRENEGPSEIRLDIVPMLTSSTKSDEVLKITERDYLLTHTTQKGNAVKVHYEVAGSAPYPFRRFEYILAGSEEPLLCLNEIAVDEGPGDDDFVFPSRERLSQKVAVQDWQTDPDLKNISAGDLMMRAGYARIAVNRPGLREEMERFYPQLHGVDWDRVRKNDGPFSQALRELVPVRSK